MSWHGGSRIFSSVSNAILTHRTGGTREEELLVALISALKAEGWDPGEAEVGSYEEDSPARKALRAFGVVEICGAEHDAHGWVCEREQGHHPGTLHDDTLGHVWGDEEVVK